MPDWAIAMLIIFVFWLICSFGWYLLYFGLFCLFVLVVLILAGGSEPSSSYQPRQQDERPPRRVPATTPGDDYGPKAFYREQGRPIPYNRK
jgi:hypothetical protein